MKLRISLIFLLALTIISGCEPSNSRTGGFIVTGRISGVDSGQAYLLKLDLETNEEVLVDSAEIKAGQFIFNGVLESPYVHSIRFTNENEKIHFFLENSEITIDADVSDLSAAKVVGSREDSLFRSYHIDEIFERGPGMEIMLNYPDHSFAAFTAYYQFQIQNISADTLNMIMNGFSDDVKQTVYFEHLQKLHDRIIKVAISKPAPEFSIPDEHGKQVHLTDFRGNYVLLDFWASWCAPCRKENPELVKVYEKFRSKDFSVIGISVDERKDRWLKAIRDDQLPWTNVSNLLGWDTVTDEYGIKAIPQNFLLDPNGVIIAKNLSAPELEELLNAIIE